MNYLDIFLRKIRREIYFFSIVHVPMTKLFPNEGQFKIYSVTILNKRVNASAFALRGILAASRNYGRPDNCAFGLVKAHQETTTLEINVRGFSHCGKKCLFLLKLL